MLKQKQQIELSRIAIRFITKISRDYSQIDSMVDHVWVENLAPMWRLNVSEKERVVFRPEAAEQREKWLACLPAVYWTSRIRKGTLREFSAGAIPYEYGLMCYEKDAQDLGLEQTEDVEVIPGGDYLVTVHEKSDRGPFTWENLQVLTSYIQKENITVHGDAFSHIFASFKTDGIIHNYHRVFMKIYS